MRAIALILAFSALYASAYEAERQASIYGMQGLKLRCDTESKLEFVLQFEGKFGFDFLRLTRLPNVPVEVLVAADQLEAFKRGLAANGIEYEVSIEDIAKVIEEERALQQAARLNRRYRDILDSFPTYDEIKSYLQDLAKKHSDLVSYFSIGKSYEDRDIVAVKISKGGKDKPVIFIDAGIHAREWIAPTTALYAIKQLAENASSAYLLDNVDFYIVPSLNPDGYAYSHERSRLWRKTRSKSEKSNCRGTDANRNFDYHWMEIGASDNPCDETYAGPNAFSEPETAALRDFMLTLKNIKVYLTLHSYGNYFLYPWSYTTDPPENAAELQCAGDAAELALSKIRGTRYDVGCSTSLMYPSAGSSDDWAMGVAGAELSYTMELPSIRYGFAPPPSEIRPVGEETFEAIKVFVKYANGEICQDARSTKH